MRCPRDQEAEEARAPLDRPGRAGATDTTARLGLCASCRWRRDQPNRRGQTFHRCARADQDDRFPRYPAIPVLRCPGHETDGSH